MAKKFMETFLALMMYLRNFPWMTGERGGDIGGVTRRNTPYTLGVFLEAPHALSF